MLYVDPTIKNFHRTYQPENRGGYIRLDQNENPDGLPEWLFNKAIQKITPEFLSIYPEEQLIIEKYARLLNIDSSNITFTNGSVVAMAYALKVFGEPKKNLICVTPTFGMYKVYADMENMNTIFLNYNEDYTFDINKMLNAIDENTSIISLVNPNMPIGDVYNPDDIEKVISKAEKYNAMVIIDEAYYYFYEKHSLDLIKKYKNVIILRTFSKMLSIPALRLGVILSNEQNIQYIKNYKPHYTINSVALAFADTIFDNFDPLIKELSHSFQTGKKYLLEQLDSLHYEYIETHGCFICIRPKQQTPEFITEELKKRNILIFCGKGDSAGFLRVTIWDIKYMEMFIQNLVEVDK